MVTSYTLRTHIQKYTHRYKYTHTHCLTDILKQFTNSDDVLFVYTDDCRIFFNMHFLMTAKILNIKIII